MLEIPESFAIAKQITAAAAGRKILHARANSSPHKLAFYSGDPALYPDLLEGKTIEHADPVGGMVEIHAGDTRILFGDGVRILHVKPDGIIPERHQLLLGLDDGTSIACTVQMYGGLWAFHDGENHSPYYLVAREKPSPLTDAFDRKYFEELIGGAKQTLSAKAFLASEQRIPGLGNGVLQDILFHARIHPKRKIGTLSDEDRDRLFACVKKILADMAAGGGRDTESDLSGKSGGYRTVLSAKTLKNPCSVCGAAIVREAYMGGNVYYCPVCQPVS